MSEIPKNLKYSSDHEWVRLEDDGSVVVGITDHAQQALGELVFVELPEGGRKLARGEPCVVVESVKAASDVFAPVSGEIASVNPALEDRPELVNEDAYAGGWLIRLTPTDTTELDEMLDAEAYNRLLADSDEY
jgi:glycine cleavage system H protein